MDILNLIAKEHNKWIDTCKLFVLFLIHLFELFLLS